MLLISLPAALFIFIIGYIYNFIYGIHYKNKIIGSTIKYILPLLCFVLFLSPLFDFVINTFTYLILTILLKHYLEYSSDHIAIIASSAAIYGRFIGISYIIGAIPFGLLITKLFNKKDVRQFGSGNTGATNVFRTTGKLAALLTLIFDFLKAFLTLLIIEYQINICKTIPCALIASICIILGHIFPIWLNFKGGKGVATALGVYWAYNIYAGAIATCTWILTFGLFRYSSLSSIIMVCVVPIIFVTFHSAFSVNINNLILLFAVALIIILSHYKNIIRLLRGDERKITLTKNNT